MHLRNFGSVVARFLCTQAQVYGFAARSFFSVLFSNILQSKAGYFCTFNSQISTAAKNSAPICQKSAKSFKATEVSHLFPRHGYCNAFFFFFFFFFVGTAFFESFCFCWLSLLCVHGEREDGLRGSGLAKVRSHGVF